MKVNWLSQLDELLRGRRTSAPRLAAGELDVPLRAFVPLAVVMGVVYGFFMGWFSIVSRPSPNYMQIVASAVKLPALFLLTLIITLPSLYVFNALLGSRLSFITTLRLLVAAVVVNLTLAASFGPILGFFTVSTTSYSFMVVLNVLFLAIAGCVGLGFLLKILRRIAALQTRTRFSATPAVAPVESLAAQEQADVPIATALPADSDDEADDTRRANSIFRVWLIIYSLVGAQMGWLLRPFIGSPDMEFTWFRARGGNFFQSVFEQLRSLANG